jgi:hypothetical protein
MSSFFTLAKDKDNNFVPIITDNNNNNIENNTEKILLKYTQFTPVSTIEDTKYLNECDNTLKNMYIISIYIVGLYIFYRILL